MSQPSLTLEQLVETVEQQASPTQRYVVGLCGPPGVGKSTVATDLVEALGLRAVVLGMDGFHLADSTLDRLGLCDVKGAPDTFDVDGFVALLGRVTSPASQRPVYAPAYDRQLGAGIVGASEIRPDHEIVVIEGNYLLLDGPWQPVADLIDLSVYLDLDDEVRTRRLVDRHVAFGRTLDEAQEWVARSDAANARLIERTAWRADVRLRPRPER